MKKSEGIKRKAEKRWYVSGELAGVAALLSLMYVCAALVSEEIVPPTIMNELVLFSVFLAAAVGGVVSAKSRGGRRLEAGAICGAAVTLMVCLAAALHPEGRVFSEGCLKTSICCMGGGVFGGALCLGHNGKRHKRR